MKINAHIEIVRSGTPRLSSMGLKSCNMILKVLSKSFSNVGITYVNNEYDLSQLIQAKPDLVFLGFKNMPTDITAHHKSQDIWLCERLDANGISYTGSSRTAMTLDHNKDVAKETISKSGLRTAPYFMALPNQYQTQRELPIQFPLFIKPPKEGGGIGIDNDSIVRNFNSYVSKVNEIYSKFQTPALVEKYLVGREFSVAILEKVDSDDVLAMPIELISQPNELGDQLLSRKIKSEDTEHVSIVKPGPLRDKLVNIGIDCFKVIGARDYGRIDFRMDENKNLFFLEANLIPGIAKHHFTSYFTTACWINQSMGYEKMLLSIVGLGLARSRVNSADNIQSINSPLLTPSLEPLLATA
jgi:D-alanine-D-alanine ligase